MKFAFVGGTGPQGKGLAIRFAMAGYEVIIGSRRDEKAKRIVGEIKQELPDLKIEGYENSEACKRGDIILITIPFDGVDATLDAIKDSVGDKPIIDVTVPLTFKDKTPQLLELKEGSSAEYIQARLPNNIVIGAFKSIGAHALNEYHEELDCNVYVTCDDKEWGKKVEEIISKIPGLKPIYLGKLVLSRYVEGLVPMSIVLNKKLKKTAIQFMPKSALKKEQ